MWESVGMSRNREDLSRAVTKIGELKKEFWKDLRVPGKASVMNKYLEFASRTIDFIELGELMARDALQREESCGCHFREEYQTGDGEALRDDRNYAFVSAWEYQGEDRDAVMHSEPLEFESVSLETRSYK